MKAQPDPKEDALDNALTRDYDGIILDIMMPKRDGIEVLSALRRRGVAAPFPQADPGPFGPPVNADAVQAARYFQVYTDDAGQVLAVDLERISSVTEEEAVQYAAQIQGDTGQIDRYLTMITATVILAVTSNVVLSLGLAVAAKFRG